MQPLNARGGVRAAPPVPLRVQAGRVVGLTLVLGAAVVISWLAVRGPSVFTGPGPFLDGTWFVTWAIQAGLAAVVGVVIGRRWGDLTSLPTLVLIVLAAWVGELVVVTALAPFLAGELSIGHGPVLWIVATGGPIQPLATITGTWLGARSAQARLGR